MRYLLSPQQMKKIDTESIEKVGIPSMVLMERAALGVADVILEKYCSVCEHSDTKVLVVSGSGNNGADGIALARILSERGIYVSILLAGTSQGTLEYRQQLSIAQAEGLTICNNAIFDEYTLIVDAIFGIGLSRDITGHYETLIAEMNAADAKIVAIDVPSGIDGFTGQIRNCAVRADDTVTFGFEKTGLVLYPGAQFAGTVTVKDAGFSRKAMEQIEKKVFTYTREDLSRLRVRPDDGNKGTFGKILLIAGSADMGGAASLSALAAFQAGAGLVRVLTHKNNRNVILQTVPEAIVTTYGTDTSEQELAVMLKEACEWATFIVAGPGISKCTQARQLVARIMEVTDRPVLLDADALNIMAENEYTFSKGCFFVTPHMREMSRLSGRTIRELKADPVACATEYAREHSCICILKDARTVVASPTGEVYLNTTGNSGMATAGSGDVLTGVIAGIAYQMMDDHSGFRPQKAFETACLGVCLHGLAGDAAAQKQGRRSMTAGDIAKNLCEILKFL